jgi:predicted GIY-YIG superfamily endonuclease
VQQRVRNLRMPCLSRTHNLPTLRGHFRFRPGLDVLSRGMEIALCFMHESRRFVYVLRNTGETTSFYIGVTSDVDARLAAHNAGHCSHTAKRGNWERHVVIEFPDEGRALRFERYLKSGSGRTFAKRHFEP